MLRSFRYLCTGLAGLLLAAVFQGQDSPTVVDTARTEVREHFVATTQRGTSVYTLTKITQLTPDRDVHLILVEDAKANIYVMSKDRDYRNQRAEYMVKDPKRKSFVKTTVSFRFKASTRDETIAEARAHPDNRPLVLTVETSGYTHTATETEWNGEAAIDWRSELRSSLDPEFLEALERMRGLINANASLSLFCSYVLQFALHQEGCKAAKSLALLPEKPDCFFDARLGFPCAEKQKDRVTKAEEEKKLLLMY
jgi:hypothetical protein